MLWICYLCLFPLISLPEFRSLIPFVWIISLLLISCLYSFSPQILHCCWLTLPKLRLWSHISAHASTTSHSTCSLMAFLGDIKVTILTLWMRKLKLQEITWLVKWGLWPPKPLCLQTPFVIVLQLSQILLSSIPSALGFGLTHDVSTRYQREAKLSLEHSQSLLLYLLSSVISCLFCPW